MSQYTFQGNDPRYRLTVGMDPALLTLFAYVEDLTWEEEEMLLDELMEREDQPDEQTEKEDQPDEQTEMGDQPDEGVLFWVGGMFGEIVDVQELARGVAPYGRLPLDLQLALLRDLDALLPQPLMTLGVQLALICQQAPHACLIDHPDPHSRSYVLLNERGWHLRDWQTRPTGSVAQAFAELLDLVPGEHTGCEPEHARSYVSDPTIVLSVLEDGFLRHLLVYALLRRGVLFSGPVVISNEDEGLTASQVQTIQQEVLFVDETIRAAVTDLWYHAWHTINIRGWAGPH